MPISNENRVRVEFFSKITPTPRGPSSGRCANGAFFSSAASARTSACSAGRQVVVAQEVLARSSLLSRLAAERVVEDRGQRRDESVDLRRR